MSIERNKYYENFECFIKNNKGSWAEKMVTNQPYYFSDPTVVPTRRDYVRLDYYWDGIDTSNPKLINTPLYTTLIDNYIDSQKTEEYTSSKFEEHLNKCKLVVMQKFGQNAETKGFAEGYLKKKDLEKRTQRILKL